MTRQHGIAALRAAMAALSIVGLAWFAGGQAWLGRIDPALAIPLLLPPLLVLSISGRARSPRKRWGEIAASLIFLAALQSGLMLGVAGRVDGKQVGLTAIAFGVAALLAVGFTQRFSARRAAMVLLGFALGILWFLGGHAMLAQLYRAPIAANSPATTLITGLPLRWSGGGDMAAAIAQGSQDDPALAALEAAGPVKLVDSLVDNPPPSGGALLLAHPRALAPQELVAIDAFVRGGGRAIILADALSGWPAAHALGDPRNPPVTSLLTPLLDHWGISLGAAEPGARSATSFHVAGARLRLFSAGRFDRLPGGCTAFAGRHIASCRIGEGTALLVGDADLLFAPLWQPAIEGAAHLRRADNIAWLTMQLRGAAARDGAWLRPLWISAANEGH